MNKNYTRLIISVLLATLVGCGTLQSPTGKALFRIGIRSAAYEIGKKNPESVSELVEFGEFLSGVQAYLKPSSFAVMVNREIDGSSADDFQKANLRDLAGIVTDYYARLHEEHGGVLAESQALGVVQAIGDAIKFGLIPSVDGSAEFVLESDSLVVVVD